MKSRGQKKSLRKSFRQRISRKNQMLGGFDTKEECHQKTKNWSDQACVKFELWHPYGNLGGELSKVIAKYHLYEDGYGWQDCHKLIGLKGPM